MSSDSSAFRSKEQVLCDLAKALGFSPEALEANRAGRLTPDQFKKHIGRCVSPFCVAILSAVLPFVFWVAMTGSKEQVSFTAAIPIFIGKLLHLGQMLDAQGKISTFGTVGTILAGLGFGAFNFMKFSPALYFDLLAREVVTREGRVLAREEQTMRPNGRDPIEKYYFDVRTDRYDVNLAAYRALESGAIYLIYVLPRSGTLIAMEPKVTARPAAGSPAATAAAPAPATAESAPPASLAS